MPDYSKAKIYKITSKQTPNIYIGSTTSTLAKRFTQHKSVLSCCSSKELLQYDDVTIELIEEYPCNSGRELTEREIHHINSTANCINKVTNLAPCNDYVMYQDDTQYIVLSQRDESFKVIQKETPQQQLPSNLIIMTPRAVLSAIREWNYDVERKKKAYHKRKEQQKKETAT